MENSEETFNRTKVYHRVGSLPKGCCPPINGLSKTRLFRIFQGMKTRCYNPNGKIYKYYGARGIRICDKWLDDFKTFYYWAINNGYTDNLTIDRIDVNGNYCPSNCRWITLSEQQTNKTNSKMKI